MNWQFLVHPRSNIRTCQSDILQCPDYGPIVIRVRKGIRANMLSLKILSIGVGPSLTFGM